MENFAKRLAVNHNIINTSSKNTFPLKELKNNYRVIKNAFDILSESALNDVLVPRSGEWLLDNFYIIEEQYNSIVNELNINDYAKLPSINGTARVYVLATELVSYTDGNIDEEIIQKFLNAYQTKRQVSLNEICFFPLMIKIALINYIKNVAERIIEEQTQKLKVESLIERLVLNKSEEVQKFSAYKNCNFNSDILAYVEYLIYSLNKLGSGYEDFLNVLDEEVKKAGFSSDEITKIKHYDMAIRNVSISNAILSIKNISRCNFSNLFEKINSVDRILLTDEIYNNMDFETKSQYRERIKYISKKINISETYIAEKLIELGEKYNKHIGVFLFDDEIKLLYESLGIDRKEKKKSIPFKLFLYLCGIYVPTILVSVIIFKKLFLFGIIPISEIFVILSNKLCALFIKPKILPRLEKYDDVGTFVIVPTLLNDKERVQELFKEIEVYYLANRNAKLYFCLLGDASESDSEKMPYDEDIVSEGTKCAEKLNRKYNKNIFYFIYRKRVFNKSQGKYLGYERKRGMICEFVDFLKTRNEGTFLVNTIKDIPQIKYIITLDADTKLLLDQAKKLIGTMEHPLNKPVIENKIVVKGYGLLQPKVGVSITASIATLFSRLYAGSGGLDIYSGANSNIYQDIFGEAIFTGKGIFNVDVFYEVLNNEIPENKVLSHDLLEGSYLRVGLVSDVELIDGFPARVNSYLARLKRWTRGDFQIIDYLKSKKINSLSKYKIIDNLRRGVYSISLLSILFFGFFKTFLFLIYFQFIVDFISEIISFKNDIRKSRNFFISISGVTASFYRCSFELILLPYKAFTLLEGIIVTIYRMTVSKKNLLEWITAEDSERLMGKDLKCYCKDMLISPILGLTLIFSTSLFFKENLTISFSLFASWCLSPFFAYYISKSNCFETEKLKVFEKDFLMDVASKTWKYFEQYMNKENNFLPPDNYQIGRRNLVVTNTSSTNIGLGLLTIISAYDLGFIKKEDMLFKLSKSIETIKKLDKWNGHLYNWYNIKTLKPLEPRFVSTVDSGNFVAYLYVVKEVLKKEGLIELTNIVDEIINNTDFSVLYDNKKDLFSIGYDFVENKLVNSYYDLLASEARTASIVAIAKNDVPYKHWFSLGRTLTTIDGYKGLVSWAGTMFEYFMPLVIMQSFDNTLLGETYNFCIYSQKKYAKKLAIPWGISESAFNLQDLNLNYQYKAFGIPWLGLKRGLKDEVVVSPYASLLTIGETPKDATKNLKSIKELGAFGEYGFFESIDYTTTKSQNGFSIVKTYMAHHQALILLSLNNYINTSIMKKRFFENPEIKSVEILLQEKLPEKVLFTKENKERVDLIKYKDYEDYGEITYTASNMKYNILSNEEYKLVINNYGDGYSKFKDIDIYEYDENNHNNNLIFIKEKESGNIIKNIGNNSSSLTKKEVVFSPAFCKFNEVINNLEITTKIVISPDDNVEIRELCVKNIGDENVDLEIISYLDPILANIKDYYSHPAYNKLFLNVDEVDKNVLIEKRFHSGDKIYFMNFARDFEDNKFEIETDKLKLIGRCNTINNADFLKQDIMFSNKIENNASTAIAIKKKVFLKSQESRNISYYSLISNSKEELLNLYYKYSDKNINDRALELAKSKSAIENRFFGRKMSEIEKYNEILTRLYTKKDNRYESVLGKGDLWKYGISGDNKIILIKIKNIRELYLVQVYIKALQYFLSKNIKIDLIILNEEKNSYEQFNNEKIYEIIGHENAYDLLNKSGGIHVLKRVLMNDEEINLILSCSDLII